jgi:hypothetical protein
MTLSQYEEAHLCPRCDQPGTLVNKRPSRSPNAMPGTMIELLECHNERCPEYMPPQRVGINTTIPGFRYRWSVQVNSDGSIPPKGSGATGPKAFELVGQHTRAAQNARDQLRYLAAADEVSGDGSEASEIARDLGI